MIHFQPLILSSSTYVVGQLVVQEFIKNDV